MRKFGAMKIERLLSMLLALMMTLTVLPASAGTLAGWEGIDVSVLFTDASGAQWQAPAVRVPQEQMTYTWWVTLPEEALGSVVQLRVIHPDPAYTYWAPDWTLNLHWAEEKNATAVDDMFTYYIGYSYNGTPQVSQMQDCMKILLSTMEPPFAYEADDFSGAVMVPAGDEGFGTTPGVELITPGDSAPQTPTVATASVTVYYKHVNGQTLDVRDVTLTGEGSHTLWPESDKVGGYNLSGDYSQTVTVYAGDYTDVASVTFWYEDAYVAPVEPAGPVTATIDVYYWHQERGELDHKVVTLEGEGTHYIYPESSVAASFELMGDEVYDVYVDANGWVDLASVSFLYRDPHVEPVSGEVTVMYLLENGTVIDNQVITLAQGYQTVYPESRKVSGLTLVSDAAVNVYVDGGGKASPDPVQFVYREAVQQAVQATVTVFIFDTMGEEIAPRQQQTLSVGTHRIEAPAGNAIPGYELISEAVLEVTVYEDGTYAPSGDELSFWYRPVQAEVVEPVVPVVTDPPQDQLATVTLRYLDSRGYAIVGEQTVTLGNGSHTLTPDYSHVPEGFTVFAGTDAQTVNVRNGRATPSTVSFYFTREEIPAAPAEYEVTVYYYDTLGNEIAPRQTLQLAPGTHWVQASPKNLPAGYQLMSDSAFQLTVNSDGSLSMAAEDVGFWYAMQQVQPQMAVITVRYVDSNGRAIAGPFTQELMGGQSYAIYPEASAVPAAYDVSGLEPVTVTVSAEGFASPAVVSFVAELRRENAQLPVGVNLQRYGVVNANSVALRSEPYSTRSNTVLQRVQKGGVVYMVASEYNTAGEVWTQVIVNGRTGYMKTEFIDPLTMEASDAYAGSVGATPVPTFTPTPSPEPTESFVEVITPVPVTPAPYVGYAVLRQETALRTGVGSGEMNLAWLGAEELVIVSETVLNSYTGESWSYVRTLDNLTGYVPSANLRQVSQQEADWRIDYWQQQHSTPVPTVLITNTPEPEQLQGYGLTTAGNVPLRRMPSEQSRIVDNLPYATVVYITGQTYTDGVVWQNVAVNGESGYIRSDLVRLMTEREETAYLATWNTATPTITPTSNPYDENGLSSFGYVTRNAVNFRAEPSTSSQKLASLNMYAMATVLDTERINGVTWYQVSYNNVTGYIHGSYFHQMTLREFSDFFGSELYYQGLRSNGDKDDGDSGYTGVGGQVSQEDHVVDNWYTSGNVAQPSFAPFLPVGTVEPINPTATPTLEPLPGYVTQGSSQPNATPVISGGAVGESSSDLPLPGSTGSVTYPMQNSGGNGSAIIWIIVILLLLLVAGGGFALVQHQRRRRQIEQRAAQRRAQQARNASGRPYAARQSGAAQPRTGAYPSYGQQTQPLFPQRTQQNANAAAVQGGRQLVNQQLTQSAPDNGGAQNPYAWQAPDAQTPDAAQPRVGRRTAWQQTHGNANDEE